MAETSEIRLTMAFADGTSRTYGIPAPANLNISTVKSRVKAANAAFDVATPTTAAEHAANGIKRTFVANTYDPEHPVRPTKISEVKITTTETTEIYHYGVAVRWH